MLDEKDFANMRKELLMFDEKREQIIKKSRDILADSKKTIYCVHRDDLKEASSLLAKARKEIDGLRKSMKDIAEIESIGAFSAAVQEYVEALALYLFAKSGKVPKKDETGASTEDYLMGICDFTGELGRRAVLFATEKNPKEVSKIKAVVDEINGELLQFNFRNGELRKKYDSVKWNLKKIEDVHYDLSIRGIN